ncbi:hypothetical protein GGI22_006315 [Coemansia erecta]|nr:hypothetical protein GGI22_006315 [Coemansia erecta]
MRQITEGLQTYSVQSSRGQGPLTDPLADASDILRTTADGTRFGLGQTVPPPQPPPPFASQNAMMLTSAALQCMQSPSGSSNAAGMDMNDNVHSRLQDRRGSIPISSSSDLFTAPGNMSMLSQAQVNNQSPAVTANLAAGVSLASEVAQVRGESNLVTVDMLDPLLFNPMTPFLQEMRLFNDPSAQQHLQQGHASTVATSNANNSITSGAFGNSNMRPQS